LILCKTILSIIDVTLPATGAVAVSANELQTLKASLCLWMNTWETGLALALRNIAPWAKTAKEAGCSSAEYTRLAIGALQRAFQLTVTVRRNRTPLFTRPEHIATADYLPHPVAPPAIRRGSTTSLGGEYETSTVIAGPAEGCPRKFTIRWAPTTTYDSKAEAETARNTYHNTQYLGEYKLSNNLNHEIHWADTLEEVDMVSPEALREHRLHGTGPHAQP
jgi:hypothetical protein